MTAFSPSRFAEKAREAAFELEERGVWPGVADRLRRLARDPPVTRGEAERAWDRATSEENDDGDE